MMFQNIFRGIATSLLGLALIGIAIYFYFFAAKPIELMQAIGVFTAGTVFLLMPDKLPDFIDRIVNKWLPKKDHPPVDNKD